MSEMSDAQAHGGNVRVEEVEVVVVTELEENIGLVGVVSTGARVESVVGQALGSPLQLMQGEMKT